MMHIPKNVGWSFEIFFEECENNIVSEGNQCVSGFNTG
jgi:hypothetical protein